MAHKQKTHSGMFSTVVVPSSHLKDLRVENFTVFKQENFQFSPHLNLIIGENGTGKSHLLKLAYSVMAASTEGERKHNSKMPPNKQRMMHLSAEKMLAVFKPENLGDLVSNDLSSFQAPQKAAVVQISFYDSSLDFSFAFKPGSQNQLTVTRVPENWLNLPPVFIPTRELLTLYPGFFSVYESRYLQFEEIYRDLCLLLGLPLLKQLNPAYLDLLNGLETLMGAKVLLDKNGRFYLQYASDKKLEMPLVAEGIRKLAMVAQLLANGSLMKNVSLFWDEPETNLNARLLKYVAKLIYQLSQNGVQTFIATHSLFLMRELEILHLNNPGKQALYTRIICLESKQGNVKVHQSDSFNDMPVIVALDEELKQSERFLEADN